MRLPLAIRLLKKKKDNHQRNWNSPQRFQIGNGKAETWCWTGDTCLLEKDFTSIWKFVLLHSGMGMNTPWLWLLGYSASSPAVYLKLSFMPGGVTGSFVYSSSQWGLSVWIEFLHFPLSLFFDLTYWGRVDKSVLLGLSGSELSNSSNTSTEITSIVP